MVKEVGENSKASDITESKRRKFQKGFLTAGNATKRSSKVN